MSPREKKLLTLFAVAGFIILNFLAIRYFTEKRMAVKGARADAVSQLESAEMFAASREMVIDEMDWLAGHEPEPAPHQQVQTKLQELVVQEATRAGLTIKPGSQKLPEADVTGPHYHRATVEISVTGMEQNLHRWIDRINDPNELRGITIIRMNPNREDDTKIDCTATFQQAFVPPPSA